MQYAVALALVAYAVACGRVLDHGLATWSWCSTRPRLAIAAWRSAATGTVGGLTAASIVLSHDLLEHVLLLTGIEKSRLHAAYAGAGEVAWAWNAAALLGGLVALIAVALYARASREAARGRRLLVPTRADPMDHGHGVLRLADRSAHAYCLPGATLLRRRGVIVVSDGAHDLLTDVQLDAVVEHERSHLRRRHHRAVRLAAVGTTLGRRLGLLRHWHAQTVRLVELVADDESAAVHGRTTVATALLAEVPRGP